MKTPIGILAGLIVGFAFGYLIKQHQAFTRQQQIVKEHNSELKGYDRLDLYYIIFGDKLKQ